MWPKVFTQLVELLPHITRLIPMADLFFQTKTASEKANEAALTALATDVRSNLGQVTSTYDGLYRQLQAHSAHLSKVAADTQSTRLQLDSYTTRLTTLERQTDILILWVRVAAGLLGLVVVCLVFLLLRTR